MGNLQVVGTPGEKRPPKPVPDLQGGRHLGDFIHCVKTREKPFRDIELAVNTAVVCHLGNIAYQLKRSLKWDAARKEFPGDDGSQPPGRSRPPRTVADLTRKSDPTQRKSLFPWEAHPQTRSRDMLRSSLKH